MEFHIVPFYQEYTYKGSSITYELSMLILGILLLPFAIINAYLRALLGLPNKRFDKNKK